jgi:hypothetical protein
MEAIYVHQVNWKDVLFIDYAHCEYCRNVATGKDGQNMISGHGWSVGVKIAQRLLNVCANQSENDRPSFAASLYAFFTVGSHRFPVVLVRPLFPPIQIL